MVINYLFFVLFLVLSNEDQDHDIIQTFDMYQISLHCTIKYLKNDYKNFINSLDAIEQSGINYSNITNKIIGSIMNSYCLLIDKELLLEYHEMKKQNDTTRMNCPTIPNFDYSSINISKPNISLSENETKFSSFYHLIESSSEEEIRRNLTLELSKINNNQQSYFQNKSHDNLVVSLIPIIVVIIILIFFYVYMSSRNQSNNMQQKKATIKKLAERIKRVHQEYQSNNINPASLKKTKLE